jgi:hypothetical protein
MFEGHWQRNLLFNKLLVQNALSVFTGSLTKLLNETIPEIFDIVESYFKSHLADGFFLILQ